jgi:hypothetical protein
MSRALLRGLRSRGIEVTTVLDEGRVGDSDRAQLDYAWQIKRVLYSFNVSDFCRLHREYLTEGKPHAGSSWSTDNDIQLASSCDCYSGSQI